MQDPQRNTKLAIILPQEFYGGMLEATKNICKMIKLGSGDSVQITLACPDSYDIAKTFADLLALDIEIRPITLQVTTKHTVANTQQLSDYSSPLYSDYYSLPEDNLTNLTDCQYWLVISNRFSHPLAPLRPYSIIIHDCLFRYVPEVYPADTYRTIIQDGFINTIKNAEFVITTTPSTRDDVISLAGIPAKRTVLAPIELHLKSTVSINNELSNHQDYFLWVTNLVPHKNHLRALSALNQYYQEYNGKLKILMVGAGVERLLNNQLDTNDNNEPNSYLNQIKSALKKHASLRDHLTILGYLPDHEYLRILSSAKFVWHPAITDNGTYAVIEAAYYGVPALSSDYAQMRYSNQQFKLNMQFFNAFAEKQMAEKLAKMEKNYHHLAQLLPTQNYLQQFSCENLAVEYWNLIRKIVCL